MTAKDGKPLDKNPLKDPRVRKAMSKMINRPAIVEKVMEGEAIPAGQLVPDFLFGATKNLKVEAFDPEGAKKLLAEAGYPDGFEHHAACDQQPLRQRRARSRRRSRRCGRALGIPTKVVAMPSATFFPQATDLKFSVLLAGWSTGTGESSSSLKALLMTFNKDKGFGTANRGRYSNTKVDALTEDALQTVDDVKREAYLQRATELAIGDTGLVPAALPGQPLGHARRHHLRAARRRADARLEIPAADEVTACNVHRHERARLAGDHDAGVAFHRQSLGSAPRAGATLPMIDPSDGEPFAAIARGNAADIDRAVRGRARPRERRLGQALRPPRRAALLQAGRNAIREHADELALIEARDCGKPLKQARADVAACARYFEFYGGACDKLHGETIPYPDGYTVLTWREPHGVTGHIIPWNYPLQIFGRSVGGALAAGNACVVKPAEDACLSLLRVAQLAAEVGFPAGALNIVTGLGREAGAALASHPGIEHLSFTGSPATGASVAAEAAEAPLPGHAGARRQVAAGRLRRCRSRCRAAGDRQRHRAERGPDLLGGQPPAGRASMLRGGAGHARRALCGAARSARRWRTSIAVR